MAHFPRPITSASSMAYSQDNLVLPPSTQRELPKPPSWRRPCSAQAVPACGFDPTKSPMSKPSSLQNAQFAVIPREARCVPFLLPLSCAPTNWIKYPYPPPVPPGFVHRRFLQRLRSSVPDFDHPHGVAETSPFRECVPMTAVGQIRRKSGHSPHARVYEYTPLVPLGLVW